MGRKSMPLTVGGFCDQYRSGLGLVVPSSLGFRKAVANILLYIPVMSGVLAFVGAAGIACSFVLHESWITGKACKMISS